MVIPVLLILLSLVVLYFAAEWLVSGGASLAARLGVAPLIIGLTIVSVGTSAPELVVSAGAALKGQSALSVGNVVGSNIFNICLILGLSAVVYPLTVKRQLFKFDVPVMIGTAVMFLMFFIDGKISRLEAGIFIATFIAYIATLIFISKRDKNKADESSSEGEGFKQYKHWWQDLALIVVGAVGLIWGSNLLVDNSIIIAKFFGMSEAIIGLTIVAAGTSMPELATSVVAAMKKQSEIAIGNVVGSNIFNVLLILGTAGLISPIETPDINMFDSIFLLAISLVLLIFMKMGLRVGRGKGAFLLLLYVGYFVYKLLLQ